MTSKRDQDQYVWVLDRLGHWRHRFARELQAAGYRVRHIESYDVPSGKPAPDLVVLGCARVGPEERELVARFVERDVPIVVISSQLREAESRRLFHLGALDVGPRPRSVGDLVKIVSQALASVLRRRNQTEPQFAAAVV